MIELADATVLPGLVDSHVHVEQWARRSRRIDLAGAGSPVEAGARLRLGSDAPVSPLDPWRAIADAVARTDDERPPWHPEQALPLAVAVVGASAGRRAIGVGDPADLAVVPGDLASASGSATVDEVRHMEVLATLVDGTLTHRSGALP